MSRIWKDSFGYTSTIVAFLIAILNIANLTFDDLIPNLAWWIKLIIILIIYVLIVFLIYLVSACITRFGVKIHINGNTVYIKRGDLFKAEGWKVIPFNEHYDTDVDDKVIARTSLNGKFILEHVPAIKDMRKAILKSEAESTYAKKEIVSGRDTYTLGRIVTYEDYMLLAFSHFNEYNEAHISRPDYERCLFTMWKEIRRTYANKRIYLPLIGSGITKFDDTIQKSNSDLLKCILCTLHASGENFTQPITILLTPETMRKIKLYEVKGAISL